MKKIISILAVSIFTLTFAQETPKKACCSGKMAKDCKMDAKKTAKSCDMKDHKNCKMDCKEKDKKDAKKVA